MRRLPPLADLHWLQIIGRTNRTALQLAASPIASDGTNQIGQFGNTEVAILSPRGEHYLWGVDNGTAVGDQSGYLDLSFDGVFSRKKEAVVASNPSYFFDRPSTAIPTPGNTQVNNDVVLMLFKMFYRDASGNYSATPVVQPGQIIAFSIIRQGMFYGYSINNLL